MKTAKEAAAAAATATKSEKTNKAISLHILLETVTWNLTLNKKIEYLCLFIRMLLLLWLLLGNWTLSSCSLDLNMMWSITWECFLAEPLPKKKIARLFDFIDIEILGIFHTSKIKSAFLPIHYWETGKSSRGSGSTNTPTLHAFVWAKPFNISSWLHKIFIFNIGSINCRIPPCPSAPKIRFFFKCFFFVVNVWSVILFSQTQTRNKQVHGYWFCYQVCFKTNVQRNIDLVAARWKHQERQTNAGLRLKFKQLSFCLRMDFGTTQRSLYTNLWFIWTRRIFDRHEKFRSKTFLSQNKCDHCYDYPIVLIFDKVYLWTNITCTVQSTVNTFRLWHDIDRRKI